MNTHHLRAACALALLTSVTVACEDIPLLPKWNADWNVPLPSKAIALFGPFSATVPPNTSANVSFAPQKQDLGGTVGTLLDQQLSNAQLILGLDKTKPVSGNDTVFVAADSLSLTNSAGTRIVVPIVFLATDLTVTDTVAISAAGVTMLRTAAQNEGTLWIQLRGRVTYAGPGNMTITPGDSIRVRLALLATIAISR